MVVIAALLVAGRVPAVAQAVLGAPGGILSGEVYDSITGRPVGYALVMVPDKGIRRFASEAGRFRLEGIGAGRLTLRLVQIGYHPKDLPVTIVADAGAPAVLRVAMSREEFVLPDLVVTADRSGCTAGFGASAANPIMNRVRANVDRIRTLEQDYPFEITFDHSKAVADSAGRPIGRAYRRTFVYKTDDLVEYRRGRVVDEGGRITLFTVSDVARPEFQKHHCFWYDGVDSADGQRYHRVAFQPDPKTKSPDWAGTLLIDASTAVLRVSEVRLANLTGNSPVLATHCIVEYAEVAPTLVLENVARCWTANRRRPDETVYDTRRLTSHRFLKRSPGEVP